MLFATIGESFGQFLIFMLCLLGFIGGMMKRVDKQGKIGKAAGRMAARGGVSLYKHLTK